MINNLLTLNFKSSEFCEWSVKRSIFTLVLTICFQDVSEMRDSVIIFKKSLL